ncbi:TY-Chap domain-containing protein [Glycomyces harbinensis]|uniref:TY-Chap N-terminal domain-containing protein n=1 Tax=Glycomyces harbinensis TaxID=58114 RepID=A0A1G7A3M4_9ACTN|nr:hypothetical protein [Glycomyces harbinensis]SDE09127.1 hypothetical protein SAMN05216270_112115 [Glycomyces harbinensis]
MLGTHRISEAQLVDLLRRARKTDFGRWSKADLTRGMTDLGWQVRSAEVDIGMWRAETGYDTGNAIADSVPPQTPLYGRADFYSIEVMVLRSAERGRQGENHRTLIFREVLRTMMNELGAPEIRGGDGGPWVRWYRDGLLFELHLRRFHGGVTLRLLSPDLFEQLEAHAVGKGDVSGWSAYARAGQRPPEPACHDMGEFTERLSSLLADMAADVSVVDTSGTVLLRTGDWSARYVAAFVDDGLRVEASAAVSGSWRSGLSNLPSMGFRAPSGNQPNWSRSFNSSDRTATNQAAHMMVDALRAFGIQDLFDIVYDGFTADGERMYLPVLGIGNGSDPF